MPIDLAGRVKNWVTSEADQLTAEFLPDPQASGDPLEEVLSYFPPG